MGNTTQKPTEILGLPTNNTQGTEKEKTNLVQGKYNSISTNYLVSSDITKIGSYGQVYIVIDHASTVVIGHVYSCEPLNAETIIQANLKIQKETAFLPPIRIWHTDRESLFTNHEYKEAMLQNHISVSRGSAVSFQNQVIESFNRTFKIALKRKIAVQVLFKTGLTIERKGNLPFLQGQRTFDQIELFVKQAIQEYNNSPPPFGWA